jgi:hypothetical protein
MRGAFLCVAIAFSQSSAALATLSFSTRRKLQMATDNAQHLAQVTIASGCAANAASFSS